MIELRRFATGAMLATIVLVVLLGVRPIRVETILAGYALALAAIALAGLTTAITSVREAEPSRFEHELARRRIPPTRPSELVRMERELTLGSSSALHFHSRLAPLLADIGVPLEELESVPRDDPTASGMSLRRIRQLLDWVEAE